MKRNGRIWITTGLLLITAALFLIGYNMLENRRAEASSYSTLERLELLVSPSHAFEDSAAVTDSPSLALPNMPAEIPDYLQNPEMEMPVASIDAENYIGILEIPSLELTLPVLQNWDYEKLKLAPCRYQGSAYQNDLIIMAHNYVSHFGRLQNLHIGDRILFTDTDGNTFRYAVLEIETLPSDGVEAMISGDWDLTLFTCSVGRESRITVRCVLENEL